MTTVYIKKIDIDLFEINSEIEHISESKPILIVDAILTNDLPLGSIIAFDVNEKPLTDVKFASVSHTLSIIDILNMNKVITKKNLSITFLGIVIKNTSYGEMINKKILESKDLILDKIEKFCNNIEITG